MQDLGRLTAGVPVNQIWHGGGVNTARRLDLILVPNTQIYEEHGGGCPGISLPPPRKTPPTPPTAFIQLWDSLQGEKSLLKK